MNLNLLPRNIILKFYFNSRFFSSVKKMLDSKLDLDNRGSTSSVDLPNLHNHSLIAMNSLSSEYTELTEKSEHYS